MRRPQPTALARGKAQRGAYLLRGILWFTALALFAWTLYDLYSGATSRTYRSRLLATASSRLFGGRPRASLLGDGSSGSSSSSSSSSSGSSSGGGAAAPAPSPPPDPRKPVAVIVLCRESEVPDMVKTMASFDEAYNGAKLHDYIVFSETAWAPAALATLAAATRARVRFALLDEYAWGMPAHIDRRNFSNVLATQTYYGNTESYRKMCRFFAGPVFTLPILAEYKYAWRLDSHVRYLCDIVDDPIARMEASGALYGYALRMKEKMDTIPSLWATAEEYAVGAGRKARVREQWDVTIPGHSLQVGCHYWNNMEITRLDWFSGPTYQAFFKHLDASGGFFYERWGDAPIRSIAMLLLADRTDVVWFEEMGYQHPWWVKCPPVSGVCFKKGVALKPGVGEGCIPDPEIQPHTFTDGAMCDIGQ